MKKETRWVILAGLAVGAAAVVLTLLGNPKNMGFCTACFLRDIAGAFKLHSAGVVQYMRPEIIGLVLGATILAFVRKEFKPTGGSSPMLRFIIGIFVMIGALVFLGCPLRMVIRLGGGDLNALVGLFGFAAGIGVGIVVLNKGFSLRRAYPQSMSEGAATPVFMAAILILSLAVPAIFAFSESGPGSLHAPFLASLAISLVVGALAQRARFCMVGGIRDAGMFRDFTLLLGFVAIFVAVLVGNLLTGNFNLGFSGQPIAHSDSLWNFLGMALVGWGSVLLGGCPLRQVILAGQGNSDSGITILGFIAGAAISHNFGLASAAANAESAGGASVGGMVATVLGFVVFAVISFTNIAKKGKA